MNSLMAAVDQATCTLNGQVVPCEQLTGFIKHVLGFGLAGFAVILAIFIVTTIFWFWMLVHAIRNHVEHKAVWILIMLLTGIVGAIIYYFSVKRGFVSMSAVPAGMAPVPGTTQSSSQSSTGMIIGLAFVILVLAGILFTHLHNSSQDVGTVSGTDTQSAPAACDNYECLASAAATCQPLTATVTSISPSVFVSQITQTSSSRYTIGPASRDVCPLTVDALGSTAAISDVDRMDLKTNGTTIMGQKVSGLTDADIDKQINDINSSFKPFTLNCSGDSATVASYLNDLATQASGNSDMKGSTETITTSTGKTLVCTIQQQPATFTPAQ